MNFFEKTLGIVGRILLGLYFVVPGIQKILAFDAMSQYMAKHDVPMISSLLIATIVLQIVGGLALIVGKHTQFFAFLLAGLTLVISVYMHNFWALPEGGDIGHETQNFVKNMAIMAGLLILAARGPGATSLDTKNKNRSVFREN